MTERTEPFIQEAKQRPTVVLKETKREKTFNSIMVAYYDINDLNGDIVGSFKLELYFSWPDVRDIWKSTKAEKITVPPKEAMISTISVSDESYRGKGFGKSTYLELLKLLGSTPLISGNSLTGYGESENGSYQIWLSLIRDGRAVEVKKNDKVIGYISIPIGYQGSTEDLINYYLISIR